MVIGHKDKTETKTGGSRQPNFISDVHTRKPRKRFAARIILLATGGLFYRIIFIR